MKAWRRHQRSQPRRTRGARWIGAALAGAAALAVVLGVALHARLARGPLGLDELAPLIVAAAERELPAGARLTLAGVALSLGDAADPRPGLRLRDLRLADAGGATLFAAPMARVDFQPLSLLVGRLRPTSVTVSGATLRLSRDPSGRFGLGLDAADPAAPPPAMDQTDAAEGGAAAALGALRARAPGPLQALAEIAVVGARLVYADAASGRVWRVERADLRVTRDDAGALSAVAALMLPEGALGPATLRAEVAPHAGGGARLRLALSGVAPGDLAAQFPDLAGIEALDAPLQGDVRALIAGAGGLRALDAQLRVGAGRLRLPGAETALASARLDFAFDPAADRFDLRRLALDTDRGGLSGRGVVLVTRDAAGAPTAAEAQVELDALTLSDPALWPAPQRLDGATATLRLRTDPLRLDLSDADVAVGPARIALRGAAALTDAGWTAEGEASGRDIDAARLAALWPAPAAPGARKWIAENLETGRVDRVDAAARLGPDGPAFGLTFAFSGGRAHYFRPLPPIEDAAGWGEVDLKRFALILDAGRVRPPGAGEIDLAGSVMVLPDLDDPLSRSEVAVRGTGPIASILQVLDSPPLGFPSRLGLDPASVAGTARATARLSLPLLKDLLLDQIGIDVTAALRDVDLVAPGIDRRVAAQALTLRADTARLRVTGDARIDGAALAVDWTETFAPAPDAPRSALALKGRIDDAQAAGFGLDPRPWLQGAAGVTAALAAFDGGAVDFTVDLDLGPAALAAAPLRWTKAVGEAARARLVGRAAGAADGGGVALSRLEVEAPGLAATGALRLGSDGALLALDLPRLRVAGAADLALSATRGAGGLAVQVDGALLDLAGFDLRAGGDGAEASGPVTPVAATLRLDALRLDPRLALAAVSGTAERRGDGSVAAEAQADMGGAVRIGFDDAGGPGRLRVQAANAGAFLRGVGLFSDGLGGALRVDAELAPGGALQGELRITDLVVADDPALTRLLTEAQLADRAREGLRFDRIRAPFALSGGVVTLDEAVAYGPLIGLTIGGAYDVTADTVDMAGVFSPVFALNAAVGRIPILGDLLTGGEGRGVVAFNFSLSGPAADPRVRVNPLSVLTPGLLRRIFEGADEAPPEEWPPAPRD